MTTVCLDLLESLHTSLRASIPPWEPQYHFQLALSPHSHSGIAIVAFCVYRSLPDYLSLTEISEKPLSVCNSPRPSHSFGWGCLCWWNLISQFGHGQLTICAETILSQIIGSWRSVWKLFCHHCSWTPVVTLDTHSLAVNYMYTHSNVLLQCWEIRMCWNAAMRHTSPYYWCYWEYPSCSTDPIAFPLCAHYRPDYIPPVLQRMFLKQWSKICKHYAASHLYK